MTRTRPANESFRRFLDLYGSGQTNLSEIARSIGISRQRVHQLLSRALAEGSIAQRKTPTCRACDRPFAPLTRYQQQYCTACKAGGLRKQQCALCGVSFLGDRWSRFHAPECERADRRRIRWRPAARR